MREIENHELELIVRQTNMLRDPVSNRQQIFYQLATMIWFANWFHIGLLVLVCKQ